MEVRLLSALDIGVLDRVAEGLFDHAVQKALAAEFLMDPRHHLAVAIDQGVVVAFASGVHYVHPDKPAELWINEAGTAPTHRRQGAGKAVVEALLGRARQIGCREAWVLTDEDNDAARALYRACGAAESVGHVMASFRLEPLEPD
jgi:aminoglycoside 6'-N-acetyltransferase I